MDIHYNSLPRSSVVNTSSPIPLGGSPGSNSTHDSNANPSRNAVAFGKQLTNQYIPHSATKSASNICQQQMIVYQPPEPTPSSYHGFHKQKGVSVPNLGFSTSISILFRLLALFLYCTLNDRFYSYIYLTYLHLAN